MNTDLFSTKKHMVFLKTLLKMLKKGSIFQVMNWQDCYQKKKKKCYWLNEGQKFL